MRRTIRMVALSMLGAALTLGAVAITPMPARSADGQAITLYTDPASGQVYTKRCKHCVKLGEYIPAGSTEEIERKVERRVTQQTQTQLDQERAAMQADEAAKQAQQQQWNAEMAKQVSEIQPFAREFGDRWFKKISIGTLVYADYRYYSHTGFGPQFLTQQVWPGPGNAGFNSFDITRTYLDFRFTPVDDVSMRVTPNMYLMINTGSKCVATSTSKSTGGVTTTTTTKCTASTGDAVGANTGWAQTDDGNLGFRVKYAYLDYNTFFQKVLKVDAMRDDKFTFGQQPNPLVDWEENLWGFRYTALTPWNYLSLSSSQVGASMKGPIKVNEIQYADYDVGVYDDASFHATEAERHQAGDGSRDDQSVGRQVPVRQPWYHRLLRLRLLKQVHAGREFHYRKQQHVRAYRARRGASALHSRELGRHRRVGLRPQCVQQRQPVLGQRTFRRNRYPQPPAPAVLQLGTRWSAKFWTVRRCRWAGISWAMSIYRTRRLRPSASSSSFCPTRA